MNVCPCFWFVGITDRMRKRTSEAHQAERSIMTTTETIWLAIGFLGQGLFFGRWVIQWITSERKAESQVPIIFWYMSLIGGLITLAYAIYRKDPVFIAGQSVGAVVYIRNLILISRASQAKHLSSLSPPKS
jgi:lipid-A-disaccharide synthase-like uncharacterized protein